jgi:hypothetical protein
MNPLIQHYVRAPDDRRSPSITVLRRGPDRGNGGALPKRAPEPGLRLAHGIPLDMHCTQCRPPGLCAAQARNVAAESFTPRYRFLHIRPNLSMLKPRCWVQ